MKTQEANNRKSTLISFGVHVAILLASLLPMASRMHVEVPEDTYYEVPIELLDVTMSGDEGSKAASPVRDPEIKPVTDEQHAEPAPVEADKISDVTQSTEEAEPLESEITDETSEEIAASDDNQTGDAEEATSPGGSDATLADGDAEGAGIGNGDGQSGMDGDGNGIITRKVIHREDITKAAEYSGVIALDICIDRRGRVVTVAKNSERTTITDAEIIRRAMDIAAGYRFEENYNAAKRECGIITFVFEIEEEEAVYVSVD